MNSLITVIVPVYNVEPYLVRCVDSVLAQSHGNFELILVNDGSTDASGWICDHLAAADARVKVIHKANGGVSSARNAGLEQASGEYVSFVDADDFVDKDFLELLHSDIVKHGADIASCAYTRHLHGQELPMQSPRPFMIFSHSEGLVGCIRDTWLFFSTCNRLYRRSAVLDVRFSTKMSWAEDQLFNFGAYMNASKSVHNAVPKYHYVYRGDSATASRDRLLEDRLHMISQMREIIGGMEGLDPLLVKHVDAREVMDYVQLIVEVARSSSPSSHRSSVAKYVRELRRLARSNLRNPVLPWKYAAALILSLLGTNAAYAYVLLYTRIQPKKQLART